MASHQAIATVGKGIVALLREAAPAGGFSSASFELYHARQFRDPMAEGISIYLYRALVSTTKRNLPARIGADGKRRRPALPIDLHYMLTPWAQTAERQHLLLGWAMRTMEDSMILPPAWLNQQIADVFGPDEAVELVPEPLALQDLVNIWEVAKSNIQVSVGYCARVVPIDSNKSEPLAPPVQTREFDLRRSDS